MKIIIATFVLSFISSLSLANTRYEVETTLGKFHFKILPGPENTILNFETYIKEKFFDGLIFHRVIPGFVVQGGGYKPGLVLKKPKGFIPHEGKKCSPNMKGTISMARAQSPHSANSQFFVNLKNNPQLDFKTSESPGYCAFARVTYGMDVLERISQVVTTTKNALQNVPVVPVIIQKITKL